MIKEIAILQLYRTAEMRQTQTAVQQVRCCRRLAWRANIAPLDLASMYQDKPRFLLPISQHKNQGGKHFFILVMLRNDFWMDLHDIKAQTRGIKL